MKRIPSLINRLLLLLFVAVLPMGLMHCGQSDKLNALVVSGQNKHHQWEAGSDYLKTVLEHTDLFTVDMALTPEEGADMSTFRPDFAQYDVVLLDYDGEAWPEATKNDFESYMRNGGGLVVFHSSNNAFPDWEAFNEMAGVGGWGERDESAGPRIYWEDGDVVRDNTPGKAGAHGEKHTYLTTVRNTEHPITKGMPEKWMHATDELYYNMRGPGDNMEVLATAYDDTTFNGGGKHEIVLMTIQYGEGRVFHTTMGHAGKNAESFPALHCAGLITSIQRGAEWAATGAVTQDMPPVFPNSASVVQWTDYRPLTLDELMDRVATYRIGRSREHLWDLNGRLRTLEGSGEGLKEIEGKMLEVLQSEEATADSKKQICRELSWMASEASIDVLQSLEQDGELGEMAKYALQRISM